MFNLNIVSETTPKMFFFILPSQKYCPFRSKVSSHTCLTVGNLDRQQILRHFPGIHFSKNFSFGTLQAIIERISPSAIFPCNFEQVRDYTLKTSCITSIPCSTSQFCSWCSWLHTYPGPWKHQQIDLESPYTFFFQVTDLFSCCQRSKSHFLDGSSRECFFVGVRYGTPHQKTKFDWLD